MVKIFNSNYEVEDCILLTKAEILAKYSQEDIFKLVFGFLPTEFEKVLSPFREDNTPKCYFEYDFKGVLRFKDFANPEIINGIKMFNISCFDAVQIYFELSNLQETLKYISKHIHSKSTNIKIPKKVKKEVQILCKTSDFKSYDKKFWKPYRISKFNLVEDGIYPIEAFKMKLSNGKEFMKFYEHWPAYVITDPTWESRVKVYIPGVEKGEKSQFFTNCKANDVGGISKLNKNKQKLIITKSYKDYRVIKNLGFECIYFQNEGMFPEDYILKSLDTFEEKIIFFDNDDTGMRASKKLKEKLLSLNMTNVKTVTLRGAKDPSDFVKKANNNFSKLIKILKND